MVNQNSFDKLENIIFDNRHKNLAVFRIGNIPNFIETRSDELSEAIEQNIQTFKFICYLIIQLKIVFKSIIFFFPAGWKNKTNQPSTSGKKHVIKTDQIYKGEPLGRLEQLKFCDSPSFGRLLCKFNTKR